MGGSETAQQPDKQLNERDGIGRQHVSDGCVTDAVSQCHSVRACPSANGHSSSFGILLPINKECRFDELLVRFRRWVGQSNKKGRRLDAYNSSTHAVIRVNLLIVAIKVTMFANANAMTTVGRRSLEALRLQPLGKPPQCFS